MSDKKRDKKLDETQLLKFKCNACEIFELPKDSPSVEILLSTNHPVSGYFGKQVISHEEGAIDLTRVNTGLANALFNHDRDIPIGLIEPNSARIVNLDDGFKGLRVTIRFNSTPEGQKIYGLVATGFANGVSIQLSVEDSVESKDGDVMTVTFTKWTLMEGSIVTIPRNPRTGVGFSFPKNKAESPPKSEDEEMADTIQTLPEQKAGDDVALQAAKAEALEFKALMDELAALSVKHDLKYGSSKLLGHAVKERMNVGQFLSYIMEHAGDTNTNADGTPEHPQVAISGAPAVLTGKGEVFNLANAFEYSAKNKYLGVEGEVAKENQRNDMRDIPTDAIAYEALKWRALQGWPGAVQELARLPRNYMTGKNLMEKYTLTSATTGTGGVATLIGEERRGDLWIRVLRAEGQILAFCTVIPLTKETAIPRQSTSFDPEAASGDSIATQTEQSFETDDIELKFRTLQFKLVVSRKVVSESDPNVIGLIASNMTIAIADALTKEALTGNGGALIPMGIDRYPNAHQVTASAGSGTSDIAATYAQMLSAIGLVLDSHVQINQGSTIYIMRPSMAIDLMTRVRESSDATTIVREPLGGQDASLAGYRIYQYSGTKPNHIYFGDFSKLYIGVFGGLDVRETGNTDGGGRIVRAYFDRDIVAERQRGFCNISRTGEVES